MPALATTADYEALTGQTLDAAELVRVSRLLDLASEAVLAGAHGQNILRATYTGVVVYPVDGAVFLPQRPVTAVSSVAVNGVALTSGAFRFTPGGNRRPAILTRWSGGVHVPWSYSASVNGYSRCAPPAITVTYTAGWDAIPAQIIAATVAVARGAYMGSADTVLTATAAGALVPEYPASNLNLTAMKLTPAVQAVVDQVCGVRAPSSVAVVRG